MQSRPLRCFVSLPKSTGIYSNVQRVIVSAAAKVGFAVDAKRLPGTWEQALMDEALAEELERADIVIGDVSERVTKVLVEIAKANALHKPIVLLVRKEDSTLFFSTNLGHPLIVYDQAAKNWAQLERNLQTAFQEFRDSPPLPKASHGARDLSNVIVDWDRIGPREFENLCHELLTQLGFRSVDWLMKSSEFDSVAELRRKDPDGFEFSELWMIVFANGKKSLDIVEMAILEPDYFLHRIIRGSERLTNQASSIGTSAPITLLVISTRDDDTGIIERISRARKVSSHRPNNLPALRVRTWDRNYLTALVHQSPQIGYKYFSDDSRARAEFRKTNEQLYRENVDLTGRQALLIAELESEKTKRARAERDAVWRDISFAAAHKIGNPVFAIETNLDPLKRRIASQKIDDALSIVDEIHVSIEKAKGIVGQFKSLTHVANISPQPIAIREVILESVRAMGKSGVNFEVSCASDIFVLADRERLVECFDELTSNAIHWMKKSNKKIVIEVRSSFPQKPPQALAENKKLVLINFRDNGEGVPIEKKAKIFDAFYTTRTQGAGLGLALVRLIVERHGGAVSEIGVPGQGADFEIFLPAAVGAILIEKKKEN